MIRFAVLAASLALLAAVPAARAGTMEDAQRLESAGDNAGAFRLVLAGANRGELDAMQVLFGVYSDGEPKLGLKPDPVEAYKWLLIGARSDPEARSALKDAEKNLTPAQMAEGHRRADAWRPNLPSTAAKPAG